MAAALPHSDPEILEDGDLDAILPEPHVEEGEEFADLTAPAAAEPTPLKKKKPVEAPAEPAVEEDDIPVELKGKSPKDLAKMYRDAQQLIGRQGTELGELRKRADQAIQASLEALRRQPQAPAAPAASDAQPPEVDETEFFAKPKDAIAKAIANHPIIKEIRETLGKAAQQTAIDRATAATERFNTAHPDAAEIMADPEFRTWVQASRVRTQLLARAHHSFDFDAGDEVFGTWKALKGVRSAATAAPAAPATPADDAAARAAAQTLASRKRALQAAAAPSSGNAAPQQGSSGKKIYRRADVLKLMEEDPERYELLAPEIELAYAENRVR